MTIVRHGLRYSAEHEWIDSSEPARIGITALAAESLGGIVFVELPAPGTRITSGEPCGEIESTKSVSELYAPVTGTVVAVNGSLADNPELINEEPYGAGWLVTVDVAAEGPLMTPQQYASAHGCELA